MLEYIRKFEPPSPKRSQVDDNSEGIVADHVETMSLNDRILKDAEATAQTMLDQARQSAELERSAAKKEIEQWWQARRAEDEAFQEEAKRRGFEQGYADGRAAGEQEAAQKSEEILGEARAIVEQAYAAKQALIAEAETFVVQLSCEIAEKIIAERIAEAPERSIQLFRRALSRRKETGSITLCVAPSQFAFINASREELRLSLDAQSELQIVPDASVDEGGCVVRSSFGSIDARVDTQLAAIREHLLRIAAQAAEEGI